MRKILILQSVFSTLTRSRDTQYCIPFHPFPICDFWIFYMGALLLHGVYLTLGNPNQQKPEYLSEQVGHLYKLQNHELRQESVSIYAQFAPSCLSEFLFSKCDASSSQSNTSSAFFSAAQLAVLRIDN
jgi:hypothetical protein